MFESLTEKEGFGVYGAPNRMFGALDMASGDLKLTDSAAATAVSHVRPGPGTGPGPGMDSSGDADFVVISGQMMHNILFDGAATCTCVSSGCLSDAQPGHLYVVVGRIC